MLIVPKIYKVVGNKGCNSYILDADEGLIIIDAGYLGSEQGIVKYLDAQLNASPDDVAYIIVTHARRSNAEAAPDLLAYCENAKIIIHKDEFPIFRRIAFISEGLDLLIMNSDTLKIGRDINVIHIPGHTPGSIAVFFESSIFVGGSIYVDIKGNFNLPTQVYDRKLLIESLRKLADQKFENIFPAYGRYLLGNAHIKFRAFLKSIVV